MRTIGKKSKKEKKDKEARTKEAKKKKKKKEINIDAWIEKYISQFIELTGLDMLGLTREQYLELLSDLIVQLYGSLTSYSNVKVVAKRYRRAKDRLNQVIAARLAFMLEKHTKDQLEFIVYNVGDAVLGVAPKIYDELKRHGLEDLIRILRVKWANTWLKRKLNVLPVECPVCGFNALMPDLTCIVCGATIREKELKNFIKFDEELKQFASLLTCDELRKLSLKDYLLLNGSGLKLPDEKRTPVDIEVYLTSTEKKLIKSEYVRKCEQESNESD